MAETCRILRPSRASYYRHQRALTIVKPETPQQDASEVALLEKIRKIAGKHPFWGYRRITGFLQHKCSLCVNRKRVRRLMRLHGLSVPVKRYKAKRAETRSKPRPTRPNEWWGTDMTKFYVHGLGWLYLVVVIDWYTKRALGYSFGL